MLSSFEHESFPQLNLKNSGVLSSPNFEQKQVAKMLTLLAVGFALVCAINGAPQVI